MTSIEHKEGDIIGSILTKEKVEVQTDEITGSTTGINTRSVLEQESPCNFLMRKFLSQMHLLIGTNQIMQRCT